MRDRDTFSRPPAQGSTGRQPLGADLLHCFNEECEVAFRDETYRVRDNGAVWRRARAGARHRKLDEVWTFGSLNKSTGYLVISDHVVHRVVAPAFHGEAPSSGHVVDHIDTNRHNNRAENLRWVTRLENILLNPITRARIEFAYGSLEAFFANPGAQSIANWEWTRTVSKEEAALSLARLRDWAEQGKAPAGGALGDWLFTKPRAEPQPVEDIETASLTPGAFQRRWRTPTEFPLCPPFAPDAVLDAYLDRLHVGAVFARNNYAESIVVEAGKASDGALTIVCKTQSGAKDWSHAKVSVEAGGIWHEAGGTFFTRDGAMKAHLRAIGAAFDEALYESIDDYA